MIRNASKVSVRIKLSISGADVMITVVIMCQQGIPFDLSPARTQIIDELSVRGTRVIVFFPGIVNEKRLELKQVVS